MAPTPAGVPAVSRVASVASAEWEREGRLYISSGYATAQRRVDGDIGKITSEEVGAWWCPPTALPAA